MTSIASIFIHLVRILTLYTIFGLSANNPSASTDILELPLHIASESSHLSGISLSYAIWNATSTGGESVNIKLGNTSLHHFVAVEFNRVSCTPFNHLKISESNETTNTVHRQLGPDELLLFIEGPSMQTLIPYYKGCNSYISKFLIPASGQYRLKLVSLRSGYAAFNESNGECPQISYNVFLDTMIYLERIKPSNFSCTGHWVHKTPNSSLLENKTYHYEARGLLRGLPLNTWTSISNNPVLRSVGDKTESCADNNNNYDWKISECPSHGERLLNFTEAAKILSHKRILLIGDSHVRTFTKALINWACKAKFPEVKRVSTSLSISGSAELCPGLSVSYFVEYFAGVHSLPALHQYDMVLANAGHHPAAGDGKWTLVEYKEAVRNFVEAAIRKGYNETNFVWLESVPQPLRNDKWFISYKDWRSYHRLKLFNQEANFIVQNGYMSKDHHGHKYRSIQSVQEKEIQQHTGFSVISAFSTTMPYIDKLCDNAHFGNEEILLPQYLGFLKTLNFERLTS